MLVTSALKEECVVVVMASSVLMLMLCSFLSLCHIFVGIAFPHLAPAQKQISKKKRSFSSQQIRARSDLEKLTEMSANNERTFIMLKPDAVHRGLVGDIIKRFEKKGFKLVAMKMMHVST